MAAGRGEEAGLKETVPPKEAVIPGGYEERTSGENRPLLKYNLVPDTPETEKKLWPLSMDRPVMTGILSMEDGRRLIGMFRAGSRQSEMGRGSMREAVPRRIQKFWMS